LREKFGDGIGVESEEDAAAGYGGDAEEGAAIEKGG